MVSQVPLPPEVSETATTEVLSTFDLRYIAHKLVEVGNECIVLIPEEEIDNW